MSLGATSPASRATGRDPGTHRAEGAGRDLRRQRRHRGVLAGQLSRSRGDCGHSPCGQQGGIQQPGPRSHHCRAGWQLREHQWRTLPVLARYDLEQWHHHPGQHIFTDQTNINLGTSFSAPIVSGIAALMLSRNNNLVDRPDAGAAARRRAALPHRRSADDPNILTCHVPLERPGYPAGAVSVHHGTLRRRHGRCGQFRGRRRAPDRRRCAARIVSPGQNVNLNASASAAACGRTSPAFAWTVVSPDDQSAGHRGREYRRPPPSSPRRRDRSRCALTVTDDQGRVDAAEVVVEPNRTTSPRRRRPPAARACATAGDVGTDARWAHSPPPALHLRLLAAIGRQSWWRRYRSSFVTLILLGTLLWRTPRATQHCTYFRCN